ncbi:MAG: hypothetical protein JNM01_06995 [Delftia acidovorans]|uniref:Uncharacterized protein n=1 Tax=Delftia acidovorans TaxID=80866 RepID=A0A7T2VX31_DELAC|nr:hypothetical protein [Delftia acidovorans]MBL8354565.1 hypothetical protein [Delftia acidovorans]QPS06250.1 hypothetical protein I6G66_18245 [Delftia acidovorans]
MTKNTKTLRIIAWFLGSLVLLVAAVILLGGVLFEARNVKKGSLLYRLGAPEYLQSVPIIEECRAPIYKWRGRDGGSNPYTSLTYGSRDKFDGLLKSYQNFFKKMACTAKPSIYASHLELECSNADFISVSISASGVDECQGITIDFVENY